VRARWCCRERRHVVVLVVPIALVVLAMQTAVCEELLVTAEDENPRRVAELAVLELPRVQKPFPAVDMARGSFILSQLAIIN
jgi:hypothetical protein